MISVRRLRYCISGISEDRSEGGKEEHIKEKVTPSNWD